MEALSSWPKCVRARGFPKEATLATLLLLALLVTPQFTVAYPRFFLDPNRRLVPSDQQCVAHPINRTTKHGSPINDSLIAFEFRDVVDNTLTDILCPGSEYSLQVSFGGVARVALLNSNPPLINFTSPTPTDGCPNQVALGFATLNSSPVPASSFSTRFKVPCSAAGSSLLFKVTSVGRDDLIWKQATQRLAVAAANSAAGDAAGGGGGCTAAVAACSQQLTSSSRLCGPSSLGYDCMAAWRNVTVHWSVNTTSAPANPCTPATKTILGAEVVTANGSLHMAVESRAPGYVALGFAAVAGKMVPSDIILGWVTNNDTAPSVGTFDASQSGRLSANNNTNNSWAYDRGMSYNAATGVTTLCFSRLLSDDRAKSVPDLRASSGGGLLAINFAVSDQDSLVKHKAGSVGGFNLDLKRGIVPVSPPPPPPVLLLPPPPPPPPAALAADLNSDSDRSSGGTSGPRNCTPSNLGYQCTVVQDKVILHWSVNLRTAPANPCTPATKTSMPDNEIAQYGNLHVAVQSATQGYVGLGFPENPGDMYDSDILVGWLENSGSAWVNTFHATRNGLSMGDVVSPSWAYDTGVVRDSSGLTTVCFSRRLVDSRARVSSDLRAAIATNISNSGNSAVGGRRRLESTAGTDSPEDSPRLGFIWAVSSTNALVQHRDGDAAGFYLDLSNGSAEPALDSEDPRHWINVHGALMAVAWGLLLPLGTLLPAHRWLLGDAKVFGKQLWFVIHALCQWTGVSLFIAGFVVAFVKFDFGSTELAESHESIGIAVMAAAGAQVVLAYIRPDPDHPRRGLWNLIHHNLGRATILLAWANVYIGIYLNRNNWGASYAAWVTPIAAVMGLLVLLDVSLRLAGRGKKQELTAVPARGDTYAVAVGDNNNNSPKGSYRGGGGNGTKSAPPPSTERTSSSQQSSDQKEEDG